ncbi:MAG: RnfABCDGE type electron transport complex subunit G [Bacillota bacterium]|nr:RnfABCDGE type electron transport complex subunit G [Bacillota bacterium]
MREQLRPTIVLLLICLAMTFALVLVNEATVDVIAARQAADASAKRLEVMPQADEFTELEPADWQSLVPDSAVTAAYLATADGAAVGYVYDVTVDGYGGDVSLIVAVQKDDLTLSGVRVLSHEETAGLGAKIVEPGFLDRFAGKGGPATVLNVIRSGGEADSDSIEAIASATISSRAVVNAANAALELSEALEKGGTTP